RVAPSRRLCILARAVVHSRTNGGRCCSPGPRASRPRRRRAALAVRSARRAGAGPPPTRAHAPAVRAVGALRDAPDDLQPRRARVGEELKLASRMQAVTLKVIMGGIFGIEGTPAPGTLEHRFYQTIRRLTAASTNPLWHIVELRNLGRLEARGVLRRLLAIID